MNSITFIVGVIIFSLIRPLIIHPIAFFVLFGLIFFLIYKLLRLKFPFSKKIIVLTIIISFFLNSLVLGFLFGSAFVEYEYKVPIQIEVRSSLHSQHSLDHSIDLVYKGKYDAFFRHLIWPAGVSFRLSADGCLDDRDEYIRSSKHYFRIVNHQSCFYKHGWPTLEQGEVIEIGRKGGEFVRETSFYKPPPEFYQEHQESECALYAGRDSGSGEWIFLGTCGGNRVEYKAELIEEQYQIKVIMPKWGSFQRKSIPLM